MPPFHTFPPDTLASNPPGLPPLFFGRESARGKGTPTSGRHRCGKRSEMADRSFLSRHAGTGTPTSGRHRCAKRSERRIAPLFHDTQVRERRPPVGTGARSAAGGSLQLSFAGRRPGNADLQVGTARRRGAEPRADPRGARATAERRSPTGIARERETSADDAAPWQREGCTTFESRRARPIAAPATRAAPFS